MTHSKPKPRPFADFNAPTPRRLTFKNGISLIGLHDPNLKLVRLDVRLLAGSCFQQKPSIAAATLKQITEGTSLLSAENIAEQLDYNGAYFEVLADRDFSVFTLYFPKSAASEILPIIRQLFDDAVFPQEKLAIYKNNSKKNLAISLEKTAYLSHRHFIANLFGEKHPYGASLNLADIDAIAREDIMEFYQTHFHAGNMRVFAAGNLDDSFQKLLDDTLGQLHGKTSNTSVFIPPQPQTARLAVERENALQSSICIGKKLFNRKHENWEEMMVLNTVLGAYFGSRLMTNIREDKGLAYGIHSRMTSFLQDGMFLISADVNKNQARHAADEIYKELLRLTQEEITQKELSLVKNYLYGSFLRDFDGIFSQIERIVISDDFHFEDTYWETCLNVFKSVNASTLLNLANTYLQPDSMAEVLVG
jgi:predicted Zn-dependent peptidase